MSVGHGGHGCVGVLVQPCTSGTYTRDGEGRGRTPTPRTRPASPPTPARTPTPPPHQGHRPPTPGAPGGGALGAGCFYYLLPPRPDPFLEKHTPSGGLGGRAPGVRTPRTHQKSAERGVGPTIDPWNGAWEGSEMMRSRALWGPSVRRTSMAHGCTTSPCHLVVHGVKMRGVVCFSLDDLRSTLPGSSMTDLRSTLPGSPKEILERTKRLLTHPFPRVSSRQRKVEWCDSVFTNWTTLNFVYQFPKKRRISTEYGTSLCRTPCGVLFISKVFRDLKSDSLFLSFKNSKGVSTVFFGNGYGDTQGMRWWLLECWRLDRSKIVILGGKTRRLEEYAVDHYDLFSEVDIHEQAESVQYTDQ